MPTPDQNKAYTAELVKLAKQNLIAIGYQKLEVDATAGGLSLTVPANAKYALIVTESDVSGYAIRYLECGNTVSTVTSSNGIPRANGDAFDIQGAENMRNFRVIEAQAGATYINVQYYK